MSTFAADNFNFPEESGKKSFLDKAKELVSGKSGSVKDKIFGVFGSWSFAANKLPSDYGTYPAGGGTPSSNQDPDNEPPKKAGRTAKTEAFYKYSGERAEVVEAFILDNLEMDSDQLLRLIVAEYTYYKAPSKKKMLFDLIQNRKNDSLSFDSFESDTPVETLLPDEFDLIDDFEPENLGYGPQEEQSPYEFDDFGWSEEIDELEELSPDALEEIEGDDTQLDFMCSSPMPQYLQPIDTDSIYEHTTEPQVNFRVSEEDANLIGVGNPTPDGEEGPLSLISKKIDEYNSTSSLPSQLTPEVKAALNDCVPNLNQSSESESGSESSVSVTPILEFDEVTTIELPDEEGDNDDNFSVKLSEANVQPESPEVSEVENVEGSIVNERNLSEELVCVDTGNESIRHFTYPVDYAIKNRLIDPRDEFEESFYAQLLIDGEIEPITKEDYKVIQDAMEPVKSGTVIYFPDQDPENGEDLPKFAEDQPEILNVQKAGFLSSLKYRSKFAVKSGWNSVFGKQKTFNRKAIKMAATVGLMAGASLVAPVSVPMTILAPAISTAVGVTSFWSLAESNAMKKNEDLQVSELESLIDEVNHARHIKGDGLELAVTNLNQYFQNNKDIDYSMIGLDEFHFIKSQRRRSTFKRALSYSLIAQTVTAGLLEYTGVTDHIASITSYFSAADTSANGVVPSNGSEVLTAGTENSANGGEVLTAGTETSANDVIPSNGGEAVTGGSDVSANKVIPSDDIDPTDVEIEEVEVATPSNGGEAVTEGSDVSANKVIPSDDIDPTDVEIEEVEVATPSNGAVLNDETFIADFRNIDGNLTASDSIVQNGVYEVNTAKGTSVYARDAFGKKITLFMNGARLKATGAVELFTDSEGTTMQFMEVMYKGKSYLVSKLHMMKV